MNIVIYVCAVIYMSSPAGARTLLLYLRGRMARDVSSRARVVSSTCECRLIYAHTCIYIYIKIIHVCIFIHVYIY